LYPGHDCAPFVHLSMSCVEHVFPVLRYVHWLHDTEPNPPSASSQWQVVPLKPDAASQHATQSSLLPASVASQVDAHDGSAFEPWHGSSDELGGAQLAAHFWASVAGGDDDAPGSPVEHAAIAAPTTLTTRNVETSTRIPMRIAPERLTAP